MAQVVVTGVPTEAGGLVQRICSDLAARQVDARPGAETGPADGIYQTVVTSLAEHTFVAVVLSEGAVESPSVQAELTAAARRADWSRRRILLVIVDDRVLAPAMHDFRHVRLSDGYQPAIDELARAVAAFTVNNLEMPGYRAKVYRSGRTSADSGVGIAVFVAKSLSALLLVEGVGAAAREAGTLAGAITGQLLRVALESTSIYPARIHQAVTDLAGKAMRRMRLDPDTPSVSAKLSLVILGAEQLSNVQFGACGGFAVWPTEEGASVRQFYDLTTGGIVLPTDGTDPDAARRFPLGHHLLGRWQTRPVPNPFGAAGSWFVVTSQPPSQTAADHLATMLDQGVDVGPADLAALVDVAPGVDFAAVLVRPEGPATPEDLDLEPAAPAAAAIDRRARKPDSRYHLRLAQTLARAGDRSGGIAALERARELAAADPWTLVQVAHELVELEAYGEALAALTAARDLAPEEGAIHFFCGQVMRRMGRLDETVLDSFRRAAELQPDDAQNLQWLGTTLILLGRPAEAIEPLTNAAQHDPARTYHRFWLGVALVQAGRPAAAMAPLTSVIDEYPHNGGALYWLGESCHAVGRDAEAKAFLQRAIDSDDVRYVEPATDLLGQL